MVFNIKQWFLENRIVDIVQDSLKKDLAPLEQQGFTISQRTNATKQRLENDPNDPKVSKKPFTQPDDKAKANDSSGIEESLILTRQMHLQGAIDPANISKAGISDINREGMNQDLMNQSKTNSDAYAARSLNKDPGMPDAPKDVIEDSETILEDTRSFAEIKKNTPVSNHMSGKDVAMYNAGIKDERSPADVDTITNNMSGEKYLRTMAGLSNSNGAEPLEFTQT